MGGKNKTKASKNLSKKRNRGNKKAKAATLANFKNAMVVEALITREQTQAAGEEIDNATLYTHSVLSDFSDSDDGDHIPSSPPVPVSIWHPYNFLAAIKDSDASQEDVALLEKEMKKDEMAAVEKTKHKQKIRSSSSYPSVSAEFATEDFGDNSQKKASYPGIASNHASHIVCVGRPGEMGPPPPRASSLSRQSQAGLDGFRSYFNFDDIKDVLGIHPNIPGGRPLPKIPLLDKNGNVIAANDAQAPEKCVDVADTLLTKQAIDADISALGLTRVEQIEEGKSQEKEYDPAAFDLTSIDRQREGALSEDQMDYVMGNDLENDISKNSGDNQVTPSPSEYGAPHKLAIEPSSKNAAVKICGCLIEAAQDVDITRDITNVSDLHTTNDPAIGQSSGYVNAPLEGNADQVAIRHAIQSKEARHQLEALLSLASKAFNINEAGLSKTGQSSLPIDPRAEGMLEAVLDGARARTASDINWVDAEIQTLRDDTAERVKALNASGAVDTLFAINDAVVDLDEATPMPNSKKRKRPKKKKAKKATIQDTFATANGADDTILTGEVADVNNNDKSEYDWKKVATELVADAALDDDTSEMADNSNKDEYDLDFDWKEATKLTIKAGVKEVSENIKFNLKEPVSFREKVRAGIQKGLVASNEVTITQKAKAGVRISPIREEMQKEVVQQEFVHKCSSVVEEDGSATLKNSAKSIGDDLAAQKRVGPENGTPSTVLSKTVLSVDIARVEPEATQLLTAFTPEVCQKLLLDDIENHGLVMGRAMLHIAAHGGPAESTFFQKALKVTQEEAARGMTDEEVDAKNSHIQAILTYYTILKSEENDDKKFLKFKDLYLAPLSTAVDQLHKVTQELVVKVGISSKLIRNVNSKVSDLATDIRTQENDLTRIKEITSGGTSSMNEGAVGFMANSCQTFSEDFKNLRALMDDRRDDVVASMKALDDTFKLHMKEHHASQYKISDVLKEVHRIKQVLQAQLNRACHEIDSLQRRGSDWDVKVQQLMVDVKLARLEVMASGGDGAAMSKVVELWAIVDGVGAHVGAANRGLTELKARVDADLAKHDKSICTLKSDVAGLQRAVKGNKTKIEEQSQDIANLRLVNSKNVQQASGLASKLEPAINGLNNTRQQVFRAISEQHTIKNTLSKNGKEISDLADVVEAFRVRQEDEQEKLTRSMDKHFGKIGHLEQRLSTESDRITATNDRIDAATSQIIKLHSAFEREVGAVEQEVGENGPIATIEKFQQRLLNASKSNARYEARKAVKLQMLELEQRVSELEIATEARANLVHATVQTDMPQTIAPASLDDEVPATPHDVGPGVCLPGIERIMAEHVPITPGGPSSASMVPHPSSLGSANIPPPSMCLSLPTILEDQALKVASQPFSSPAMDRAMHAPAGAFAAPNIANGPSGPACPVAPMPMPAMVNGVPEPFSLGGPGADYPPLFNGSAFGDGGPPPHVHFGLLDAIGHDLRAMNARITDVDARFTEFQDTILYLPDQVRHATQDARYEMGVEQARIEKELTERFAWLSNDHTARLELVENAIHRIENSSARQDQEQIRLEGMICDVMRFVGMPSPASGQKRKSMEQMVIEIMDFVGMRRGFGMN